jgi:hypothetical protein
MRSESQRERPSYRHNNSIDLGEIGSARYAVIVAASERRRGEMSNGESIAA